jgi:hypothetical protein
MSKRELIEIRTPNKDILTSFVYAWSRQKEMSLIEQRVVLRIIERASIAINGIKLKDNMRKLDLGLKNVTITMPVQDVMLNTKRRHSDIEKALYNLRSRTFEYRENGRYTVCGFINNATYTYGSGEIKVEVDNKIWEVLLDFTSGFHRFELNKALALPTTYSLQFYMAMSGQNQPRQMTIEQLKDWLAIPQDSYKTDGKDRIDHLEARILKPVKKVLDEICPYSFTYEKVRQNPKNKKSPVVGFILRSHYLPQNRDPELEKKSLLAVVSVGFHDPDAISYMKTQMGITLQELNPHKELLDQASRVLPDFIGTLARIQGKRRKKNGDVMGTGWVIKCIKNEVNKIESEKTEPTLFQGDDTEPRQKPATSEVATEQIDEAPPKQEDEGERLRAMKRCMDSISKKLASSLNANRK